MNAPSITLRPTESVVEINDLPARIWTGQTSAGLPVYALIAVIAVDRGADSRELAAALVEQDGARFRGFAQALETRARVEAFGGGEVLDVLELVYRHVLEHGRLVDALVRRMRDTLRAASREVPG